MSVNLAFSESLKKSERESVINRLLVLWCFHGLYFHLMHMHNEWFVIWNDEMVDKAEYLEMTTLLCCVLD